MRKAERSLSSYYKKNESGDTKDQEVQVQFRILHGWAVFLSPMVYLKSQSSKG